jgi:soluble lytic murein transglycosylase
MRLPWGCAITAAAMGFMASSGCMSRLPRAAAPVVARTSPPTRTVVPTPPAQLSVESASTPVEDTGAGFDPGNLASILDDPALVKVKALASISDAAGAAKALEKALSFTPPGGDDDARWRYQLGKLRAAAGDAWGAAHAFDQVADAGGPLTAYARFAAAQVLLHAGYVDEALARIVNVPEDAAVYMPAQLMKAEALVRKRDFGPAIEIWRGYLADSRHPLHWIDVALRLGEGMLDERADAARGEQAALLARRVIVEAPTSSAVPRALDLEHRALAVVPESKQIRPLVGHGRGGTFLPADYARALSPADQLTRASALADSQLNQDALKALDALSTSLGAKASSSEVGCRMQLLLGSVLGKVKDRGRAADVYGSAIDRCAPYPDAEVEAMYYGGRASVSAGRCDEAMDRFARVEKTFHEHRYADDARLRAAECALDQSDESRYEDMLSSLPTDYPDGDMVPEGLFRLAMHKMQRHQWDRALVDLTTALDFKIKEAPSSTSGRLAYFRARALFETGDVDGAERAYSDVITTYPLSYYMLHAYARLAEIHPAEARVVLERALSREPRGKFFLGDDESFHSIAFLRAAELLRQGENDYAKRELGKVGLMKEGAPSQGLWGAASLFARAGLVQISHSFPKNRVYDWLGHYPAGRWREAWEIAYPRPFPEVVEREAKRNDIPAALAYAVMREESAFDPEAVSPARAYGLMQLIFPTAKKVARDVGISCDLPSLSRPETNVALGCRFLADLRAKFASNPLLAIPGYNAGPGAPQRWMASRESEDFDMWVEQIPYEETRRYTKRVLASFGAYAFLYESDRDGVGTALKLPKAVAQ